LRFNFANIFVIYVFVLFIIDLYIHIYIYIYIYIHTHTVFHLTLTPQITPLFLHVQKNGKERSVVWMKGGHKMMTIIFIQGVWFIRDQTKSDDRLGQTKKKSPLPFCKIRNNY